jgi:hypothetical protein
VDNVAHLGNRDQRKASIGADRRHIAARVCLVDARLCAARCTIVPPESNNLVLERAARAYVGLS